MESNYREIIRKNLENTLESAYMPELGKQMSGKVREVYFLEDLAVLVTTDRISAFDQVLARRIPFKGAVLTGISAHTMELAEKVVPTAMMDVPDPNVMVQRRMKNIGIECVVRGYLWGSMAASYEEGDREFCGLELPHGLIRYQKLDEPVLTPTTKADVGHDEPMTFEDMAEMIGPELALKVRETSLSLFHMFSKEAAGKELILIDTKYEFGLDDSGELFLIDEVNTPDSSRFCEMAEWESKMTMIKGEMDTGDHRDVTELLRKKSEMKIEELSKQFVRDILLENQRGGTKKPSGLTDEQDVETALKYIGLYERFVGEKFVFDTEKHPKQRIVHNLRRRKYIHGGCVSLIAASEKDQQFCERLMKVLDELGVPYVGPFYASAHKETRKVLKYLEKMERSIEPVVFITSAGRSNGLGPVVAGNTRFPVIACNPYGDLSTYVVDIYSSLRMPSKLPLAVIIEPGNAVLFAKRILDLGGE